MTRYQVISSGGVWDNESRAVVPPDRSSPAWAEYESWLTSGNSPLPPSTVGQDGLAASKLKRQSEINAFAAGLRNKVVRGRSAGEMASWSIKIAEARAFTTSSDPKQAPTLALTAQIRGIELSVLSAKVLEQAAPFLQVEAAIDGVRGRHCDAVDSMDSVAAIVTYDWMPGWPVL